VPGSFLCAGDRAVTKTKIPAFMDLHCNGGRHVTNAYTIVIEKNVK
jgi:hypothetical protein